MNDQNNPLKKSICHLSSVHPYFDSRIFYKECRSLAADGYPVRFVARKEDGQPITVDGVDIIPFREYPNRCKRILFSPFSMFALARRQKAHIYHFHDPELLPVGMLLKLIGKKVIYDVHEDYSQQLLHKYWLKSTLLKQIIAGSFHVFEVIASLFFDRIVTATDDIAENFPASRTVTIRNLPVLRTINEAPPVPLKKEKPVLIYAGALARVRGVKEVIQAVELLKNDVELLLLGKWESDTYRAECENLAGWQKVKYLGLKKPHEVYGYMKAADIGLSLLYPISNYLTSLPVKAFEYLACGLPMVMSNFKYWQEIFAGCAVFTDPSVPQTIAEQIDLLLDNPQERQRLRQAGLDLVHHQYSWEAEHKRLLEMVHQLTVK